jgi:hypothetical protein
MDLSQPARQSEFEKSAQKRARTSKIEREILIIDTQNGQKRTCASRRSARRQLLRALATLDHESMQAVRILKSQMY